MIAPALVRIIWSAAASEASEGRRRFGSKRRSAHPRASDLQLQNPKRRRASLAAALYRERRTA